MKRKFIYQLQQIIISSIIVSNLSFAQTNEKEYLGKEEISKWQSIESKMLSKNGEWACWEVRNGRGEDSLFLQRLGTGYRDVIQGGTLATFSENNLWFSYYLKKKSELVYTNLINNNKFYIKNGSSPQFTKDGNFLICKVESSGEKGTKVDLKLINLITGSSRDINDISSFSFNNQSNWIAYSAFTDNRKTNSLKLLYFSNSKSILISKTANVISDLAWCNNGFFYRIEDLASNKNTVFVVKVKNKVLTKDSVNLNEIKGISKKMIARGYTFMNADMSFAFFKIKNYSKIYPDIQVDNNINGQPNLWHWRNPNIELQIQEKYKSNGQKRDLEYLCAYNFKSKKFVQIERGTDIQTELSDAGNFALLKVKSNFDYKMSFRDVYLVDLKFGTSRRVIENFVQPKTPYSLPRKEAIVQFSPDETKVVFYNDGNWFSYDIINDKSRNLTENIDVRFWDKAFDEPGMKQPFGWAGWSRNSKFIYLYDKYDVYCINIEDNSCKKITDGKKEKIIFRINTEGLSRTISNHVRINSKLPIILTAFGEMTKASGYFEIFNGSLKKLVYKKCFVSDLIKAENADVYLYAQENFNKPASLLVVGHDKMKNSKIYQSNVFQDNYYWGKSELINYKSKLGHELQGALFYPANYQPGRKYPMIVNVYERLSDMIHRYPLISFSTPYNKLNFINNDYFFFQPDIVYEMNNPGISAANCVIPAVETVLKTGMIDQDKVGLMGHSWGGYETAFLITQTNLFKAAIAGAPLTDLISMSLGVRWDEGSTNQLFEGGQARFLGPFYEHVEDYIRNSPVYQAKSIKTPLLISVGDKDGLVDWHQGIEMYNVLRRMQKPCIMLVYENEGHNLLKVENAMDYTAKQMEYFDYYLKNKPAANWILGDYN